MIDISHMSRRPVTMVEEDIVTRVRNCSDSFNVISSKPERVYKDVGGYFDQRPFYGLIGLKMNVF